MKPKGIKYLVSYHPAIYDLPADTAGTLDVVNMLSGNVFWFDGCVLAYIPDYGDSACSLRFYSGAAHG